MCELRTERRKYLEMKDRQREGERIYEGSGQYEELQSW
jgi:hypothetical protein